MTLEDILANKSLAIHRKKSEIQKSDFSNILFDTASKAFSGGITKLEVLVYEAIIKKERNEEMFKQYLNGWVLNHSVGMRYIKLLFCYNSDSPEYTQEKDNWDKYYPQVLNKEDADLSSYFWAILEAKNVEGSAVVKGSNFLTPVLSIEIIDENTIKVKCAISPSNILDSHKDVHIPGLWKKSINENQYDLLLQEHDMEFEKVIVDSVTGDLKVYTQIVDVKELLSRFEKNKTNEPSNDTQPNKQTAVNLDTVRQELKQSLSNLF